MRSDVPLQLIISLLSSLFLASLTLLFFWLFLQINDDQVLSQVIEHYEKMRDGYAIADATVSLQSIPLHFFHSTFLQTFICLLLYLTVFHSKQDWLAN